jgi:hypothetical protein
LLSLLLWWVLPSSLVLITSFLPCFPEQYENPEQSGETKALRFAKNEFFWVLWMSGWVSVRSSRDAGRMGVFFFLWKTLSLGILMLKNLSSEVLGLVSG